MREIVITHNAANKLDALLEYLKSRWSEHVKENFIFKLEKTLSFIVSFPNASPRSDIKEGLHKCIITRQTTLFYTFDDEKIYIISLFDTRMDPKKIKSTL